MTVSSVLLLLAGLAALGFVGGRRRAFAVADASGGIRSLHSLPGHYGLYAAIWCGLPALMLLFAWKVVEPNVIESLVIQDLPEEIREQPAARLGLFMNDVKNLVAGNIVTGQSSEAVQAAADHYSALQSRSAWLRSIATVALAVLGLFFGIRYVHPDLRARNRVEQVMTVILIACSTIAIFTTVGIVLSVVYESIRFFQQVPVTEFLFGLEWSPQTALRADQVGSSGAFGAVPLFAGTALIALIAMLVAAPIGLMTAIYLSEYAAPKVRTVAKPLLEILAGIPTVVYGFFAALTVAPFIRGWGESLGLSVASESALVASSWSR